MLKLIHPLMTPELLYVLRAMGHGDNLVICDRNHPATTIAASTTHGTLLTVFGATLEQLSEAVLTHFPLDTFVDSPVTRMKVVDDPEQLADAHLSMQRVANAAESNTVSIRALERFAFYKEAAESFAIVQTSDPGPYGCFILKKGVL